MKKIFFVFISLFILSYSIANSSELSGMKNQLLKIIDNKKATVGISLFRDGNEILSINNECKYPLLSVFKFHQALAVCDAMQRKNTSLESRIYIHKDDLHKNTYSPLRDSNPNGEINISIRELLNYTLQLSDNNACDILFKYIIDPDKTDKYIRSLGITNFNISESEKSMHDNLNNCYNNWTYPSDAAKLLDIFINKNIMDKNYQDAIKEIMIKCDTGKNRLPKYIKDKNVIIGHKTGSGDKNRFGQVIGINDIGFFILPNGIKYTLAVFVKDSEEPFADIEELIAQISKVVYNNLAKMKI